MIIDPLAGPQWDECIRNHAGSTVFHSSAWARVLVETYGHRPCYLRISAKDKMLALVPMMEVKSMFTKSRGICLPFSDYCAPLMPSSFGRELVIQTLRQIARERCWNYFELRDHSVVPDGAPVSKSYVGHSLDLRIGNDALASNFSSSAQRALRKARRCGLSVKIRTDADAMSQFYKLHVRTRHRLGVPPQPRRFFVSIQRNIINASLGFIVAVEREEKELAAAVFFRSGDHAVYKFGASDRTTQELRPNNLAMSEAIKVLADSGVQTLHFGRTDKGNEGLRRFKLSWGAREEEIRYAKFDVLLDTWVNPPIHQPNFHNDVFRTLPAPVNRLAGVLLYPHLD